MMRIGPALDAVVRQARPVTRRAWDDGTWLARCEPTDTSAHTGPMVVIDRPPLPGELAGRREPYVPSQDDLFADDWVEVE